HGDRLAGDPDLLHVTPRVRCHRRLPGAERLHLLGPPGPLLGALPALRKQPVFPEPAERQRHGDPAAVRQHGRDLPSDDPGRLHASVRGGEEERDRGAPVHLPGDDGTGHPRKVPGRRLPSRGVDRVDAHLPVSPTGARISFPSALHTGWTARSAGGAGVRFLKDYATGFGELLLALAIILSSLIPERLVYVWSDGVFGTVLLAAGLLLNRDRVVAL